MTFSQITWRWDGWAGAPGFTAFRMLGDLDQTQTDAAAAAQKTFLGTLASWLATGSTIACDTVVKIYADGDGSLVDQRSIATVPTAVTGSQSGAYSAVTGVCVVWRTNQSTGRRMLMGRSFLIPLGGSLWAVTGQVGSTPLNTISTAANTYVNRVAAGVNGRPVVWHRPSSPGATDGFSAACTGATVNKSGSELRRRRD